MKQQIPFQMRVDFRIPQKVFKFTLKLPVIFFNNNLIQYQVVYF